MIDLQRRAVAGRVNMQLDEGNEGDDESWMDDLFDSTGHWREAPQARSDPEAALQQRRFWEAFEKCLDRLPAAELEELQRHLDKCFMCRNFESQLKFLHRASERLRSKD